MANEDTSRSPEGASLQEVILQMLIKIETDIAELNSETKNSLKDVHNAFLRDEDNMPDFVGHKLDHRQRRDRMERMENYKQDVVKKIMGGAAMALIGLMGLALLDYAKQRLLGG